MNPLGSFLIMTKNGYSKNIITNFALRKICTEIVVMQ